MKNIKVLKSCLHLVAISPIILMAFFPGHSQSPSVSVISGTISDNLDAVIPNAVVILTNGANAYRAITKESGEYTLSVAPGIYEVTAQASDRGFETTYRSNIKVDQDVRKSLNLVLYAKHYFLVRPYGDKPSEVMDHPPMRLALFNYEDIPRLSENEMWNGKIRFGVKCESKSIGITTYRSGIYDDNSLRVTFTYDFFTVIADEIALDSQSGFINADGNITIDNGGDVIKYRGTAIIRLIGAKATYQVFRENSKE